MRVIRASGTELNELSVRGNGQCVQRYLLKVSPDVGDIFDLISPNAHFLNI